MILAIEFTRSCDYRLEKRVIAIIFDNATSNNRAIELLKPKIGGYHSELLHQRCACHIINLIVKSGIDIIHMYIDRVR